MVGILALLLLGALIAGGISLFSALTPKGGSGESAAQQSAASSQKKAQSGTATSAVCDEAGIKVSSLVDKTSYGPEENPKLTLRITNTGQVTCDINVGTSQMEFKITSGTDVIFNSKDCLVDPTNLVKNLKPGASESANFTWKRNRSTQGCASVAAKPGGGGASYAFVATLGKWSGEKAVFLLQ